SLGGALTSPLPNRRSVDRPQLIDAHGPPGLRALQRREAGHHRHGAGARSGALAERVGAVVEDHVAHEVVAAIVAARGVRHPDALGAAAEAPDQQDLVLVRGLPGLLLVLAQLHPAM